MCVREREREREREHWLIRTPPYYLKSSKRRPWPVCENSWFSSHRKLSNPNTNIELSVADAYICANQPYGRSLIIYTTFIIIHLGSQLLVQVSTDMLHAT